MVNMDINDLTNLTQNELSKIIVDVTNEMEVKGNQYMDYYENSKDKDFDMDKYTYASGLLTYVNRIKAIIYQKNNK